MSGRGCFERTARLGGNKNDERSALCVDQVARTFNSRQSPRYCRSFSEHLRLVWTD
jgi:hypothetical protein